MLIPRTAFAVITMLVASTGTATAQRSPVQLDSARAQIHATLRAFYFNLAHQDWAALTVDILPAKVVAHRPTPEAPVRAATSQGHAIPLVPAADDSAACSSKATALVDRAAITLDGDWAEVSVPRCLPGSAGADAFRLIHFQARWRFVYIDLFPGPVNVATDR